MAGEELLVSLNEREFILKALSEGQRADGRNLLEMRQVGRRTRSAQLDQVSAAREPANQLKKPVVHPSAVAAGRCPCC